MSHIGIYSSNLGSEGIGSNHGTHLGVVLNIQNFCQLWILATAGVWGQVYGNANTQMTLAVVLIHVVGLVGQDGVMSGICGASLGSVTA